MFDDISAARRRLGDAYRVEDVRPQKVNHLNNDAQEENLDEPRLLKNMEPKIRSMGLKWKLACVIPTVLPSTRDPRCFEGR